MSDTLSNEALAKELDTAPNAYPFVNQVAISKDLRDRILTALLTPPVREDVLEVVKHAWDAGYSTGQDYRDDPPYAGLGKHNRRHGWETYACSLSDRNLVVSATLTTPENSELVTQADRDRAADFMRDHNGGVFPTLGSLRAIRLGLNDDHPLVQAFARHRIEAIRTAQATPAGEVELLEGLLSDMDEATAGGMSWIDHADVQTFKRRAKARIAALTEPTTKYGHGSAGSDNNEG